MVIATACATSAPVYAQSVTGTGVLNPGTVHSPEWNVGGDLIIGDYDIGELTIADGGRVTNDMGIIGNGVGASGTVTVVGGGSTWSNSDALYIGYDGSGVLSILAGGTVSSAGGIVGAGGAGDVLISGENSSWLSSARLSVGLYSAGTLRAEDRATISSADGVVGDAEQGDVVLTGVGTTWTNAGQFTVGSYAAGTLRIEDGAVVTSSQGYIGASDTGSVTVTGAGSKWWMAPSSLTIGNFGVGALTVENGGLVHAEGGVLLGVTASSSGTLLLQGPATNRGILETTAILGGDGAATVTLDGGILRALANSAEFFSNFGSRNIAIGANGALIDTNGFDIAIAPSFLGGGDLIKDGAGKLTLSGDSGSTFTGAASVIAGTLAVNGVLGGTMDVISGRLQGTGTVGLTVNHLDGTIAPGNSIGTLTISGDYLGNGGQLEIETVLGDDRSSTDLLVITGATAGTTMVRVLNQGGAGAQTVEGIKIVDVGGASNGVFLLQGDYSFQGSPAVIAGAYAYTLQKNGLATPNDGDWYLRSSYLAPTSTPPVASPIYQPGAPVYEAYGQVLQSLNGLQTLRQRVGDRLDGANAGADGRQALWSRIDGDHRRVVPDDSTTGIAYTIDSWRFEAGADGQFLATDGGTLVGGITVHHGQASADVSSVFGQGTIGTAGTGLGGSLTWYGASGFYADAQTKLTWFGSDLYSATTDRQLAKSNGSFGYALGIEVGQRIPLSSGWSLTPQAQLIYGHVGGGSFTDPFGATVALGDNGALRGRLGLSADYRQSWRDDSGREVNASLYGIANLYYDLLNRTTTTVSGTALSSSEHRPSGGLGLGAKYDAANYSLYGEIEAQAGLPLVAERYAVTGRVGLRVSW